MTAARVAKTILLFIVSFYYSLIFGRQPLNSFHVNRLFCFNQLLMLNLYLQWL